ncbi:reverse transcriptase domain-containing protein [Tanacetum coccineum]|uniref:Reverse transcriptase domain-containing protein n=1 Tax=Tanacetum coccineum TaxID=301880 RepID=A0ABQ5IFM5_9ASTR
MVIDDVPSSPARRPPLRARMGSSPNCTLKPSNSFEWRKTIFEMVTSMGIRHTKVPNPLRQIRNEDLRTKLKYFSEDYDEEHEMEPRPERTREVTPPLHTRSPRVRRQHERVVGFEEVLNREGSRTGRNTKGRQSSINIGGNLHPNGTLLSHHAQPFIPSSAHVPNGFVPTHVKSYSQPSAGIINGQTLSFLFQAQTGNPSIEGTSVYPPQGGYVPQTFPNGNVPMYNGSAYPVATSTNNYPFHTQPMYAQPNMPMCPNPYPTGLFADPTGSITPFVCWIEDYPIPDGLKMPSHVGSYDGKEDPDNFLHLFKGAIRMQKWLMHVACHVFTYTLKDSARIWWNSQKAGSILNYEDIKAKFRSHFSQQKRFTKTHLVVHNIKQREGESDRAFATRHTDDTLQILGLHKDQRIFGFMHGLRTRNLVEHLFTDLPFTYKGLMEKTYTWIKAREVATNGALNDRRDNFERSRKSSWTTAGDIKVETWIKKERAKTFDSQQGEKKEKSTTPAEAPILMINQEEACTRNNISKSPTFEGREITFPLVMKGSNSSAPVVIKAKIFGREVGRVHMDSGSSCEVIYEHCFLKLKPSIQASKVDSQVPLVGFSGGKSWAIGEVLLEITIGDAPLSRSETINFIIVRSNSPYNMLLGRTAMQKIGMVVSTIHRAVKFYTTQGIGTVFSTHKSDKIREGVKKIRETSPTNTKDTEEKIIVNSKTNTDVFVWTHADMTGIPKTITVDRKPFNMEHKLNEYSHIKPIKKRRSLCPDRSTSASKEVEELTRAEILREVAYQTWVANPVMVKKSDGGWRICVDFTDINKACPKTITLCPRSIGSTLEEDMLTDIKETFQRFQSINMKLNPKKCSFGVEEGPFLGHLITKQGIRANPSKVKAIADTKQPKTLKDIQSLNGKLAALSRFMSKGAKRSLPFFKVLKSCTDKKNIQWTQEVAATLKEIKKFMKTLPTLTAPIHGEVLMMYLAASTESISADLFARREEGQVPIYFETDIQEKDKNKATNDKTKHENGKSVKKSQSQSLKLKSQQGQNQVKVNPEKWHWKEHRKPNPKT